MKAIRAILGGTCVPACGLGAMLFVAVLSLEAPEAGAIPVFARKYRTSCTTCHVAIPKRNAFGEAFRRNGFVMPRGDARLVKEEPVSLGADAWKEVWPDAVWPGELPASFPFAAYVHQRFVADFGKSKQGNQLEFDAPHEFELLVGGAFGQAIGFFGEWVAFEKGVQAPGLKRFFFQFNDLPGPKNLFNLKVGRFEPGITDGYTDSQRLTMEHPITLDYRAAGKWRGRDQQSGIELNGIVSRRFQYAVGAVNGEAKTVADESDRKDIFARVGGKLGGLPLDGIEAGDSLALRESDAWSDRGVGLGIYTYFGTQSAAANQLVNDFRRFGFDIRAQYDRLEILGGAIFGLDDNPSGLVAGTDKEKELTSAAYFAEADYLVFPWLVGVLRVERAASKQNDNDKDKFILVNPNMTMLVRANVRLSLEGLIRIEGDKTVNGQIVEAINTEKFKFLKVNALFVF